MPASINMSLFDQIVSGTGTAGTEAWIDLGVIPTPYSIWIGMVSWTAIGKTMAFELRTNNVGAAVGTIEDTARLSTASVKSGNTSTQDLYRKGRLYTVTVPGTGIEHWWIRIRSKSGTLASYMYKIIYTVT